MASSFERQQPIAVLKVTFLDIYNTADINWVNRCFVRADLTLCLCLIPYDSSNASDMSLERAAKPNPKEHFSPKVKPNSYLRHSAQ